MKIKWVIAIALVVSIGIFVSGPYLTINSIKDGIKSGDQDSLSENIDFHSVRQSLKDQLNVAMAASVTEDLEDNPFGILAMGFATKMVDGMVDSYVTPAGLARISSSDDSSKRSDGTKSAQDKGSKKEPFEGAEYSWESPGKFVVTVPDESGKSSKPTRMILKREGLKWRLVNIILPLEGAIKSEG